jgi:hypothetical protein
VVTMQGFIIKIRREVPGQEAEGKQMIEGTDRRVLSQGESISTSLDGWY